MFYCSCANSLSVAGIKRFSLEIITCIPNGAMRGHFQLGGLPRHHIFTWYFVHA